MRSFSLVAGQPVEKALAATWGAKEKEVDLRIFDYLASAESCTQSFLALEVGRPVAQLAKCSGTLRAFCDGQAQFSAACGYAGATHLLSKKGEVT